MPETILLEAPWSWQSGAVLGLLVCSILFSKLSRKVPRDLVFTAAALLTALLGIVSSKQIYTSCSSQAVLATVGLWLLGKAMQQQGIFHFIVSLFPKVKEKHIFGRGAAYLETAFCGAFLQHRYFLMSAFRPLMRHDGASWMGYAFCMVFAIGGLATAIGTPANLLLATLYSLTVSEVISNLFIFLPLSILPILLSIFFFLLFHRLFDRGPSKDQQARIALLKTPDVSEKPTVWKKSATCVLFLGAIAATLMGTPVGTAFFCAGLIALLLKMLPVKNTLNREFPLPPLLDLFSATLFFFAMLSSGLSVQLAKWIAVGGPLSTLTVLFFLAQIAAHWMSRTLALSLLFSAALSLFAGSPAQILMAGTVIAFATVVPLFGRPSTEETALASAVSAVPSFSARLAFLLILFASTVFPVCLFWPT